MISTKSVRAFALSFEGATEQPHFELTSFRVKGKIFLTLDEKLCRACVMLSPIDQSVFIIDDLSIIYPVPNSWGRQGATYMELKKVRVTTFKDAVRRAYNAKSK